MKNKNLKNKLSVMVVTHLIRSENLNEPYYENDMIVTTIKSSHEKLKLHDVIYYVYIDSVCQPNTSYSQIQYNDYIKYKQCLSAKIKNELPNINVKIVENTGRFKDNFRHMLDNCNTDYFLFLEHDWEFIHDINVLDIINCMDTHAQINYIKFNRLNRNEQHWDKEEGGCFESELSINTIPLVKIAFYSGNPHIMRTNAMKDKYLKWYSEKWNDEENINPYLEKDLFQIAMNHKNQFGKYKQHELWGCFLYGNIESLTPVINHLGDWCRKK